MATGDGLVSMTPSSIAFAGTSATTNAKGGVDFTSCTSVSLNGVFTAGYENYLVTMRTVGGPAVMGFRYRASGTDASGTDYVYQLLAANGTSLTDPEVNRSTSQTSAAFGASSGAYSSYNVVIYGPFLSIETVHGPFGFYNSSGSRIWEYHGTHMVASSYDGLTLLPSSGSISGAIHIWGFEE